MPNWRCNDPRCESCNPPDTFEDKMEYCPNCGEELDYKDVREDKEAAKKGILKGEWWCRKCDESGVEEFD